MEGNTYHYIIFGSKGYYQTAWSDVMHRPGVQYIDSMIASCHGLWQQLLTRWCFSLRWGKYCPKGLCRYVYQHCMPKPVGSQQNLCFLFFECWYAVYTTRYMDYLKTEYPQARFVWYLQDIVRSNPLFDIEKLKPLFDVVCSYDPKDCEQYGLYYLPTPYSKQADLSVPLQCDVDVFFCGHAKNRLTVIRQICESAMQAGLKCAFYITGVAKQDQIPMEGIVYNHPLSYTQCLQKMVQASCIVEVMQQHALGYTPRLWEAIMYEKHLVTNNTYVFTSEYAHDAIHEWKEDMDWSWMKEKAVYPQAWKEALSPLRVLTQLDSLLDA